MSRMNSNSNPRIAAGASSALAAVVATMLIAAAPAQADHFEHAFGHHVGRIAASHLLLAGELFFGPPVPVPVYVQHEVVYQEPYYEPYYVEYRAHRHGHGCGHGWQGRGHGRRHDRHDYDDDDDWQRGGYHRGRGVPRREVMHRGDRY